MENAFNLRLVDSFVIDQPSDNKELKSHTKNAFQINGAAMKSLTMTLIAKELLTRKINLNFFCYKIMYNNNGSFVMWKLMSLELKLVNYARKKRNMEDINGSV